MRYLFGQLLSKRSHWSCSMKKGSFKILKIHRNTTVPEFLYFGCRRLACATLLKNKLRHKCLHMDFAKFSRTLFSQNISGWMLLLKAISAISQSTFHHCYWTVKNTTFLNSIHFQCMAAFLSKRSSQFFV